MMMITIIIILIIIILIIIILIIIIIIITRPWPAFGQAGLGESPGWRLKDGQISGYFYHLSVCLFECYALHQTPKPVVFNPEYC